MASDTPAPNEEDDLFNFDALFKSAPKAEPPPTNLVATVVHVVPATVAPASSATPAEPSAAALPATAEAPRRPTPPRLPPGVIMPMGAGSQGASVVQPPLVKPVAVTREPVGQPQPPPAPRSPTFSLGSRPGVLTMAALVAATLVNFALVGVVWRSLSGMGDTLREVGDHVARAGESAPDEVVPPIVAHAQIAAPQVDEAELALERAAEDVRLGEYERARVRLYSLLAVLDRFDPKLRGSLATRAQVLAADSYREQADQLDRSSADAPRFLPATPEEAR